MVWSGLMVLIATFSGGQLLLLEETGGSGENHRSVANHGQPLSHSVMHLDLIKIRTHTISGDSD